MHVDRSRFLLLTASLAASACNTPGAATTPDTGNVEPTHDEGRETGTTPADSGAVGSTTGSTTGSGVWLEIEPGTEDPKEAAWGDPNCNNSVGTPKSCGLTPPGPACESFEETQRFCEAFPRFLQPRAAEAAVDCMLAMNGTESICDWNAWQTCALVGAQNSCTDPASRSPCMTISSACGGSVDVFQCQQAFAAVRPSQLSQTASCIQEFCEIPFCLIDMSQMF